MHKPKNPIRSQSPSTFAERLEPRVLFTAVVVNTVLDQTDAVGSGTVSLRDAVAVASAANDAVTITFDPTVFAAAQTITLGSTLTLINMTGSVSISGASAGITISSPSPQQFNDLNANVGNLQMSALTFTGGGFLIEGGAVTLTNVTFQDINESTGNGAGIYNSGQLTMLGGALTNNISTGNGGGLANAGTATLQNVLINNNQSTSNGGGIYSSGTLTVRNCLLFGNSALNDQGGGVDSLGTGTLINDTIANNLVGGGVVNGNGALSVSDCTVVNNHANERGGGFYNYGGTFNVANTVVANNTADETGPDASGSISSLGNNFVGQTDDSSGWTAADLTGTTAAPLDPGLGVLANNGGPTQTILPNAGSRLIDAGSNALVPTGVTIDQRNYYRIANAVVDIGAAEYGSTPAPVAVISAQLAFTTLPASSTLGRPFGTVAVSIEGADGTVATGDTSTVTLAIASGPGSVLGTMSAPAVNGVATFTDLSFDTAGAYTLTATDGGLLAATSTPFTINPPAVVKSVGGLDPTFGNGGLASHDVGFNSTTGVATDGAQSILIGPIGSGATESFGVTRYNADGSLDTTFGTNGVTATSLGGVGGVPSAVSVLASGDILVAGTASFYFGDGSVESSQFAVAEYTPNGSLDTTFGQGGIALINFPPSGTATSQVLRAMAIGSNGSIFLGGHSTVLGSDNADLAVAALTAIGATDTAFGNGAVVVDVQGGDDVINALAVQSNGDLVAAAQAVVGGATEVALARFLPGGTLDPHFGTKGIVTANVGGTYDAATSVALQPKGQIIIGGVTASGSGDSLTPSFLVQRYTSVGKPDRTFGGTGSVTTSFNQPAAVTQVIVQPDGSIVASGRTAAALGGTLNVAIAKYTAKGAADMSFAGTGHVIIDLSGGGIVPSLAQRLSPADSLSAAFDAFVASQQGVVAVAQGGEILAAGNSGSNTVEAELVAAGVDLVAHVLSSLPASVLAGVKATVSLSITESGTTFAAGAVTVNIQFATDSTGDAATIAKTITEKLKLKQGQTSPYHVPFNYPTGLAAGEYYLVATIVNGTGLPADLNEQNNTAASAAAVQIAPATVDLLGSALSGIGTAKSGGTLSLAITLTNTGNVTAKGKTTVAMYLSTDGTIANSISLGSAPTAVGLPAGKSRVVHLKIAVPTSVAAGQYQLLAIVDPSKSLGAIDQTDVSAVLIAASPVMIS